MRSTHRPEIRILAALGLILALPVLPSRARAADESAPALTDDRAIEAVEAAIPHVEMIRGLDFKQPVPVRVIGDEEARRYVSGRIDRFYTPAELEAQQQAYVLLGLMPEGMDLVEAILGVMEEQAGGFYDPQSKSFVLLDDMPLGIAPLIAAHELTHAVEDQYYDLDSAIEAAGSNDDLGFALGALHEGSAMLVMSLYTATALADGTVSIEDLQSMGENEAIQTEKLNALPDALKRPMIGSYLLGMNFLARGDPASLFSGFPTADVNRCYENGPVSSEQILHPEKFWDEKRRDDPTDVDLGQAGALLGKGWQPLMSGVLGELVIGPMVGAPTPEDMQDPAVTQAASWTNPAASGWDGDRWELWGRKQKRVLLFKSVWDTEDDAAEFVAALTVSRKDMHAQAAGRSVAIVSGTGERQAEALLEALLR